MKIPSFHPLFLIAYKVTNIGTLTLVSSKRKSNVNRLLEITDEPRYPVTLRTRKKCRHMRSVAVTGVG